LNNQQIGALEGVVRLNIGRRGLLISKKEALKSEIANINAWQKNRPQTSPSYAQILRAAGETEQRLYLLEAWRESPFYTDRERAALAWAEAVTLVTEGHVPDEVFAQARKQFSEEELANLTLAVVAINGWNRLNIAFRTMPSSYQPATAHAAA